MADIDVGAAAIHRGELPGANTTLILKENPANADGEITLVAIYVEYYLVDPIVAIFEKVNGNTFTARSHQAIATLEDGYHEIAVSLQIKEGDYIGYIADGWVSQDAFGEGLWYLAGDQTECVDAEFTFFADKTLSIYGTGSTVAVGRSRVLIVG